MLSPPFPCVAIPSFLFQSIVGSIYNIFVRCSNFHCTVAVSSGVQNRREIKAKGVEICILYRTGDALVVTTVPDKHQKGRWSPQAGHVLHLLRMAATPVPTESPDLHLPSGVPRRTEAGFYCGQFLLWIGHNGDAIRWVFHHLGNAF